MRYTPLATDALCPMPYALCPMPARAPHVTEKGYILFFPGEERPITRDKMSKAGSMGVHFC